MSEWSVAVSQSSQPAGDIVQAAALALDDGAEAAPVSGAVAGIRRVLLARGRALTGVGGVAGAAAPPATRYRDPQAYQAYIEEMACLP